MASITLQRHSTSYDKAAGSYRFVLEVTDAEGIKKEIFVNQRIRNIEKQTFEDMFVAVATPAQLEDFGINAPNEGSSYFLTKKIDVISRNADYLEDVFNDIVSYVQKLVAEVDSIATLSADGTFVIDSSAVTLL